MRHDPWSRGKRLIWDVAVKDSRRATAGLLAASALSPREEGDKRAKYELLQSEFVMVPFVIEATGVWGESPLKLFKEIGRRITARDGDNRATHRGKKPVLDGQKSSQELK